MHVELQVFGRTVELSTKALPPLQGLSPSSGGSGWWPFIRESFTGAWQQNVIVQAGTALTYFAVFACQTLIASDIGKVCLRLVEKDADGIWTETESPSFSPVLRKPNRYQSTQQFIETWVMSLLRGNTYVLKERDQRGVVVRMYVLDPMRVTPLVSQDGAVYYQLGRNDLAGLTAETVTVPASEIIHDRINTLYHPLIGLSPIYACGMAAVQGLAIQGNSSKLFSNGSIPGGVLTAPGAITNDTAARLKTYWDTNFTGDNVGKVAVLGDGLKYEQMSYNAVDMQLIEQLNWTGINVCACHHVPPYLIDIGAPPPYANIEPVIQKYFSQCLQSKFIGIENGLDEGLGLTNRSDGKQYGVEFDINDLIWMDMTARNKAAADGIGSGGMSPNEARKRFFGLGKVTGGDSVYMQQQNYSLAALAERDKNQPFAKPAPATPPPPPTDPNAPAVPPAQMAASFGAALRKKALEADLVAA